VLLQKEQTCLNSEPNNSKANTLVCQRSESRFLPRCACSCMRCSSEFPILDPLSKPPGFRYTILEPTSLHSFPPMSDTMNPDTKTSAEFRSGPVLVFQLSWAEIGSLNCQDFFILYFFNSFFWQKQIHINAISLK